MTTEQTWRVLITVDQMARVLQVKKSWLYAQTRLKGSARLPHTRVGRYVRFTEQDFKAILEKWRTQGNL